MTGKPAVTTLAGLVLAMPVLAQANDQDRVDAAALYSQGMAVVQDSHKIKLDKGEQTIDWPVMDSLKPETFVLVGKRAKMLGFELSGQGQTEDKPLHSRIGHKVILTDRDDKEHAGRLVNVDGQTAYVQVGDRIEQVSASGITRLSWPQDKQDNGHKLKLHVGAQKTGKQKLKATYQAEAPQWQASYTGHFDADKQQLTLAAQAIINNDSAHDFQAKKAWLVTDNAASSQTRQPAMMMARSESSSKADAAGQPEAVGDIYRYPLAHGLSIAAGSVQSVALMDAFTVDAKRAYRLESYAMQDSGDTRRHAQVSLHFDNDSQKPLPAGAVHVYDGQDKAQLLGSTQLDDTPADAPVVLDLGTAFDVTATHQVIKRKQVDGDKQHLKVQVKIHNASEQAKRVTVAEHLPGNAQLDKHSPQPGAGSADKPEWRTTVPAKGDKTLTYSFTRPAR